jgi:CDP-paratose 2-epimerase
MKVVVTGHNGFIGSHLSMALKDEGHEVIGFDRKPDEPHWSGSDLSDLSVWEDYDPPGADLIVHLASTCSTSGSLARPVETFRDTVITTATVCEWARREKIPLLLTSSVKARDGMTPYGAAKRMAETWAFECARSFGFPVIVNRPGTVYGPGQEGSPESGWIAWFLKAKHEGFPVTIYGDGEQMRDLLYVDDYVDLLMRQAKDPPRWSDHVWDVGGGIMNAVTVKGMAHYLDLDYTFGPGRYGDAYEYIGINTVADDWRPKTDWKKSGMFPHAD